ncbi:hypothetical protein [Streptomyces swartbergensis]|uniref:hypothetical protein n=1 Tax=Streptomyces swartbergensis TaxID=487165 RepID=UPI001ABF6DD2
MNQPESDDHGLFDHCPWLYAEQASQGQRAEQEQRRKRPAGGAGSGSASESVCLGEGCVVAETAAVFPEHLYLGDRSCVAGQAYVTEDILHDQPFLETEWEWVLLPGLLLSRVLRTVLGTLVTRFHSVSGRHDS